MFQESIARFKAEMPAYWRKVQWGAASLVTIAFLLLQYQQYIAPEAVPYLQRLVTIGLTVVGVSQFTKKDTAVAELQTRLTAIAIPVVLVAPGESPENTA